MVTKIKPRRIKSDNPGSLGDFLGYQDEANFLWGQGGGGQIYTAGRGIAILNGLDYSAMRGPCDEGFHIPMRSEFSLLISTLAELGITTSDGVVTYLKIPITGSRAGTADIITRNRGRYWTCIGSGPNPDYTAYAHQVGMNTVTEVAIARSEGCPLRGFSDVVVIPDNNWIVLYDGSSIATGAGIFHNTTNGLISVSSDGINRITIADKNLGASVVYNYGDNKDESNCGKFYQWGNNYGFPRDGSITTSDTRVDASSYGPGNYYSSSTFILTPNNPLDRSSVTNDNLRGGVTGVQEYHNAITNTGVLSVNGQTGDITIPTTEESNTKTFYPENNQDLNTWQQAYDWAKAGNEALVYATNGGQAKYLFRIEKQSGIPYMAIGLSTDADEQSDGTVNLRHPINRIYSTNDVVTGIGYNLGNYCTDLVKKQYVDDSTIEYEAGPGIAIYDEFNDAQGPCQEGWHIPSPGERQALILSLNALGIDITNNSCLKTYCKMPAVSYRRYQDGEVASGDVSGYYWSSKAYENGPDRAYCLITSGMSWDTLNPRAKGMLIRPFKNKASIPTSSWTTLIENSYGGVYYDSTSGQISITNYTGGWITIADKNLGATQVYDINYAPSDNTIGYFYQRGNNNGFLPSGNITTSSVQVDTTGYQAPNYYSDNTFIIGNLDWSSVDNKNLRGGLGLFLENAIVNTGVLSVNGQTGNVIVDTPNVKVFYIETASDSNAQEAVNWYFAGGTPIISYENCNYFLYEAIPGSLKFRSTGLEYYNYNDQGVSKLGYKRVQINFNNSTHIVYGGVIDIGWDDPYLRTDINYTTPYTPTYNGSPATKKYVDDSISAIVIPTYTAGENISIDANNEISAIDTTYSAGTGINIDANNEIINTGVLSVNSNTGAINLKTINSTSIIGTGDIITPITTVEDNLTSTSTTNALSANQGRILDGKIADLMALGKFLSLWNATTGQPISFPYTTPYAYSTGDYFLVEVVDTTTNYRPDGSSYTGTASSIVETDELEIGDVYIYDGNVWLLQSNHGKTVSFANITGQPTDNTNLATALAAKQDNLTAGTGISISSNTVTNTGVTSVNGNTGAITVQDTLNYYSEGTDTADITVGSRNDTSSINVSKNNGIKLEATRHGHTTSSIQVGGTGAIIESSNSIDTTTVTVEDDNVTVATPNKTYSFDNDSTTGIARLSDIPASGIQNDTTGTTTTVTKIWAGTEAEYNALQSHDASTIYHIY